MEDRLYYQDPYLQEFSTSLIEAKPWGKNCFALKLKETAFYPTSGGQPHDKGYIGDLEVLDVFEEGDDIWHLTRAVPTEAELNCKIDWPRRFDFMQQHAGQHLLSEAFWTFCQATTIGFHLTEDNLTIDLDMESIDNETIVKVEDTVNQIIWDNRPIIKHWVAPEDLEKMPLRKQPQVDKNIRIVEMKDYDWVPCGGTHPNFTGEIGMVKIRRWERSKGVTRVEFFCGQRALQDYRWKNEMVLDLANDFSVKDKELADSVQRLQEKLKETERRFVESDSRLTEFESEKILKEAEIWNGIKIVKGSFDESRDLSGLRKLAINLLKEENILVLLVNAETDEKFLFARSADLELKLNKIYQKFKTELGGKGGGSEVMIQGSLPENIKGQDYIEAFIEAIKNHVDL